MNNIEIERRFLVDPSRLAPLTDGLKGISIEQGYLSRDPRRIVRVRIAGNNAFLTIKGLATGGKKLEIEAGISLIQGRLLMSLCPSPIIKKVRYAIQFGNNDWIIDAFHEPQLGLVIAELELEDIEHTFPIPSWLGKEITDDPSYANSNLI